MCTEDEENSQNCNFHNFVTISTFTAKPLSHENSNIGFNCRLIRKHPTTQLSTIQPPNYQLSNYPTIQLSSYPAIQLASYPTIQLSNYPTIQLSYYPTIQLSN